MKTSVDATAEFNQVVCGSFVDKVLSDDCNSWLAMKAGQDKKGVLTVWPGTGHHRFDILRDPRLEDFVLKRREDARVNRYEYFGTERERRNDIV